MQLEHPHRSGADVDRLWFMRAGQQPAPQAAPVQAAVLPSIERERQRLAIEKANCLIQRISDAQHKFFRDQQLWKGWRDRHPIQGAA